jgi:hypothetical protein
MNVRNLKHVIRLTELASGVPVLTGTRTGTKVFAVLAASLPESESESRPLFVDFTGIELASASFLRETVLPLKALARAIRSSWYPVVANASAETLEDLEVVCSARSDVVLACDLTAEGIVHHVRLIGALDTKQREAYEFVGSTGGATAKALMEATASASDASISPTAWNNRLNALVEKGIVSEIPEGRQKSYAPILRTT